MSCNLFVNWFIKGLIYLLVIIAGCLSSIAFAQSQREWTQNFQVERHFFKSVGENPYFILKPGYFLILKGDEEQDKVKLIITVLKETKIVDSVETRTVEEREFRNNELIEVSNNYFAIDSITNSVFYFGEDVDIYKNGQIVSHRGAWLTGENNAEFGLMMPGIALLGARYYQEVAPGIAMDRAEIMSLAEVIETSANRFSNCLKIEETTPLEPDAKEYKLYAPGVGLVKDGNLMLVEYGYK